MKYWIFSVVDRAPWRQKQAFMVCFDLTFNGIVFAFLDSSGALDIDPPLLWLLPIFISILLYISGAYSTVPRFFGAFDASRVIMISGGATVLAISQFSKADNATAMVCGFAIAFGCLSIRVIYANWRFLVLREPGASEKVIIIGAGSAGLQLLRSLRIRGASKFNPVGFVDDHENKLGMRLDGVAVLGSMNDLARLRDRLGIETVIIAIPSASSDEMRRIVSLCQQAGVSIKTLPGLRELADADVGHRDIRLLNVEDLLGRERVDLDQRGLENLLSDRAVLITGAGGSIGSELAMQVSSFGPKLLVLLEQSELALYELDLQMKERFPEVNYRLVISDVRNYFDIDEAIRINRPSLLIHAAAYKHVPLVELNPMQAVKTNVAGSRNVVRSAIANGVENFILVSTDKAVNPTNVMGATKRLAEIVCQEEASRSGTTKFTAVRFGNVLGSSGSVIPLFKKQIREGGPVTVTHPEITRYFMLIPEAAQLVLQASLLGEGGEIFVLDMGDPVRIADLAATMIRSSGLLPGEDIEIVFSGLRPGEKLYEELLADSEKTIPTSHRKISIAKLIPPNRDTIDKIHALLALDNNATPDKVSDLIHEILPEFKHNKSS